LIPNNHFDTFAGGIQTPRLIQKRAFNYSPELEHEGPSFIAEGDEYCTEIHRI